MPYQNLLDINKFKFTKIIWVDVNIHNEENTEYQKHLSSKFKNISFMDNVEELKKEMQYYCDFIIVTSGSMCKKFIEQAKNIDRIKAVIIFTKHMDFFTEFAK